MAVIESYRVSAAKGPQTAVCESRKHGVNSSQLFYIFPLALADNRGLAWRSLITVGNSVRKRQSDPVKCG